MRGARVGSKSAACILFGTLLVPIVSAEATIVFPDAYKTGDAVYVDQ